MEEIKRQLDEDEYKHYINQWKIENKELIDSGKCRKVFLENLPRWKKGGKAKEGSCNWIESINKNYKVFFIYEKNEGFINLKKYNKGEITLQYHENEYRILSTNFSKAQLGSIILGKYKKDYRFEIKQVIKDNFGEGKIIEQIRIGKTNNKGYIIKCENCNHIYRRTENHIIDRDGFKCPNCYNKGNSFGEKFLFNVFQQLNINFEKEKTFDWSKNVKHINEKLCGRKRYDFLLKNYNIIVESHGRQHYEEGFQSIRSKTLIEEQENDKLKRDLAIKNGINPNKYIIIDCRKSELEWIKNSIINSDLKNILDLSLVDWNKCIEYASKDIVQTIIEIKNNNPQITINEISKLTNLGVGAIRGYIHQGVEMGLCRYDAKEEMKRSGKKAGLLRSVQLGKEIICIENGIILKNSAEYERQSVGIFGEVFSGKCIARVSRGERKTYKGFQFKFTQELTEEQIKEIQENAKLN